MRATLARAALVVALVAIAATAQPGSALAAPAWLAPTDLSAVGDHPAEPGVAVDSEGDAVAVWDVTSGTEEVVQSASRPAGGSWSAPVGLSATGEHAEDPQVAVDPGGDAVATWTTVAGAEKTIHAVSRPAGRAWSAPVEISPAGAIAEQGRVALDAHGEAVATWLYFDGGEEVVQSATLTVGGAWSAPVDVSANGPVGDSAVGVDADGDAVAVWEYYDGMDTTIQSASRPAGGAWSPAGEVSAPGEDPEELRLAVDAEGDAVAVWENYLGPTARVAGAFRPAGGSWSPAGDLSASGETAFEPALDIDPDGDAVAVWTAADGTEYAVRTTARPRGGSWSPPLEVSAPAADLIDPTVAVGAQGNAVAAWSVQGETSSVLQAATEPAGGSWSAPAQIAAGAARWDAPALAADDGGDAVAVWEGEEVIQAAGYDDAGPLLRSLSIPTTGTVGQALSFAVSPLDAWSAPGPVDWSFGDGATAAGAAASHTYSSPGTYAVSLGAADALGNGSGASGTVTIAAAPAPGTEVATIGPGRAKVARLVWVRHGRAEVRMSCPGSGRCAGALTLSLAAKPKKGRAPRRASKPTHGRASRRASRLRIGGARFAIAAGKKATVRVKLTRKGAARVRAAAPRGLEARLGGTGVRAASVTLRERRRRRIGR